MKLILPLQLLTTSFNLKVQNIPTKSEPTYINVTYLYPKFEITKPTIKTPNAHPTEPKALNCPNLTFISSLLSIIQLSQRGPNIELNNPIKKNPM